MDTRNKQHRWLLRLLGVVFLLAGLTACGSSEGSVDEKEPEKPKPEVPVADGDWQVVPATGGTITKDSVSITFPSGTFSEETKVAITEVKKGEIGGEYEASPFYQITLPCNASKPMTIKIKSAKNSDDISFVANSPGHCISTGKTTTIETILETKSVNGEYSTTIPAIDENDESENVYFTIGLGHMISYSGSSQRTRGRFDDVLREGKVNNVSYKIRFPWSTLREYKDDKETLNQVDLMSVKINEYVQQALKHIFDLKFKVAGNRNLRINFVKGDPWLWGGYEDDWMYQDWSVINLSIRKLFESSTTETDIKSTVIHELFHFVQSDYDPRWQITKGSPWTAGGDYLTMYEMGAVWIEHLMNGGQLNSAFVNECLMPAVKYDKWGFTVVKGDNSEKFQDQGYRWGPLLYYLCSNEELKRDYGFNNESVLELHNQWKEFFYLKPFIQIMNDWTYFTHHYDFFSGFHIDDYYLELLTGKLVKGVDALSLYKADYSIKGGRGPDKEIKDSFKKLEFEGNNYPYGCSLKSMHFQGMKDVSMKDKKLVVKQERKDVHTYLLTTGKASDYKSFRWSSQVASGNDSIVISGSTLEGLRQSDGSFDQYFFIVTTRETNSYTDSETLPWKVTVELQGEDDQNTSAKVEPDKVEFDAMGGSNNEVKIIKGSYKNCGVDDVEAPDSKWLSAKGTPDGAVTIEAKPNMSFEGRKGEVKCWVSNKDNPQPGEKKYLTVEVIQNGVTGVDWNPKELRFTASGGSEKISFEFGGFTRFGAQVHEEGYGWCGVAAANGKLTITVQPNTTKDKRECIVDAYVTNSQNPTDDEKLLLPITVYQEGAKETKPSSLKIKSVVFSAEYNDGSKRSFMVDWNKKEGTIQAEIINGSTHVTCTNNTGYNKSTLSFDIDNESLLTSKKATFSNFKTEGKEYSMGKIANEWNIATKSKSDYDYYTRSDGVKTCSLSWKQGEFAKFEHSQSSNSITLSDSRLSELEATVSIFFEEPPQ